jgi:Amt family ammonium transporter
MGLAQEAEARRVRRRVVYIFNTLLFLIGGFLVFFMAAGFAMLEGGLVRSKNVTMQMTKNIALFSIAAIMYWLIGYNLMYPAGDWAIDGYFSALFPSWGVLEPSGMAPRDAARRLTMPRPARTSSSS